MNNTVPDWMIEALQRGYPMNRKTRRAALKRARVYMNKTRRYAIEGSLRAQKTLASFHQGLVDFSEEVGQQIGDDVGSDNWETLEELEHHAEMAQEDS